MLDLSTLYGKEAANEPVYTPMTDKQRATMLRIRKALRKQNGKIF